MKEIKPVKIEDNEDSRAATLQAIAGACDGALKPDIDSGGVLECVRAVEAWLAEYPDAFDTIITD